MAKDHYDIRVIFEEMTMNLIASMKRNLSKHQTWEEDEGFRWEQWQAAKLRGINEFRKANRLIIGEADRKAAEVIDVVVEDSFIQGARRQQSLWDRIVNTVLKPFGRQRVPAQAEILIPQNIKPVVPASPPIPWEQLPEPVPEQEFFRLNEGKVKALQNAAKKDVSKANGGTLRKMDDVYRQVIFKAEMNMAAGAKTLDQAIDMATKDFLEQGIATVTYSDGRKVPVASYAEIALRTVSQRATFTAEGAKRDGWGVYTVVMSSHDNCSPWCLPFQGTVLIDDVYTSISKEQAEQLSRDTGYLLLSYAMEQNAFHPACRHTLATWFPGISQMPKPADPEKALESYEAEQKQRYMERQIRKYKRLELGSLDEANQAKYGAKVIEWQDRLKAHFAEHPQLRRDRRRDRIDGEVPAKDRKELLKNAELNAKMEEIRQRIKSDDVPKNLHMGHQGKHIPGHNNYIEGKSYLTISAEEAQELVNRYAGTGAVNMTKKGEWKNQELIDSDTVVGKALDQFTGEEFETSAFKIHYGKKGVHIVPTKRGEGE